MNVLIGLVMYNGEVIIEGVGWNVMCRSNKEIRGVGWIGGII